MIKQFHTGAKLNQNRYKIEVQYKEGGQAFIYIATDLISNKPVIIKQNKISDDHYLNAIDQERKILTSLDHPLLPKINDFFSEEGFTFLVMNYIVGEDLDFLVTNKKKPFSAVEVIGWIAQLLDILKYLQGQDSLVHGDIKPKNIRLGRDGNVYLLDFGVTSKMGTKNAFVVAQSPNYSSPEQLRDETLNFASDVYSLGATAYYLLTGIPPENALVRQKALQENSPDTLAHIVEINPEIPVKFANLIESALSINSFSRPQNAQEMYLHLQRTLETTVSERLNEDETIISSRTGRVIISLDPKQSEIPTERMNVLSEEDVLYKSPQTATFFTQDATVEALHLIQLVQENSLIVRKLAHIIVKVMDSPPSKRNKLIDQFGSVLNNFPPDNISTITNFLHKLANYSVCDPEIEQQLRSLLGNILIANLKLVQENNEIQVENIEEKEKLRKLNYAIFIWMSRGVATSIPIGFLLSWFFNTWLGIIPTSIFVILWIALGSIGLTWLLISTKIKNGKKILKQFLTLKSIVYALSFSFGIFFGGMIVFIFLRTIGII